LCIHVHITTVTKKSVSSIHYYTRDAWHHRY